MILTPRLSNSGLSRAIVPSSVVHTGVKSFGCENSTTQLLPIHSWNRILPSVVWASKSGAVSLIARVITHLRRQRNHQFGAVYTAFRYGHPVLQRKAQRRTLRTTGAGDGELSARPNFATAAPRAGRAPTARFY